MRLTNKEMSVEHENWIARVFGGKREAASGANPTKPGDVYIHDEKLLFECKTSETGRVSISRKGVVKLINEAAQRGCRPMWAFRLRDPYGGKHIDVIAKLADDELEDRE